MNDLPRVDSQNHALEKQVIQLEVLSQRLIEDFSKGFDDDSKATHLRQLHDFIGWANQLQPQLSEEALISRLQLAIESLRVKDLYFEEIKSKFDQNS